MAQLRIAKAMALVTVMTMMMTWTGARAQSSTTSSCTNVLLSLSPCLDYISGNSTTPSSKCCTELTSVVGKTPQCLCQVLTGGASSLGISINQTQAMNLPVACKVQTPPISQCKAASPAGSPTESPTSTSSGSSPKTEGSSSNGNSNKLSFSVLFSIVFVATIIYS